MRFFKFNAIMLQGRRVLLQHQNIFPHVTFDLITKRVTTYHWTLSWWGQTIRYLPWVEPEQNLWWDAQQFFLMYLWRQYWYAKLLRNALQDILPAMLLIRSSHVSAEPRGTLYRWRFLIFCINQSCPCSPEKPISIVNSVLVFRHTLSIEAHLLVTAPGSLRGRPVGYAVPRPSVETK